MKTIALLLIVLLAGSCYRKPALIFRTIEVREFNGRVLDSRNVFVHGERPGFCIYGSQAMNHTVFVKFFKDGQLVSMSPSQKIIEEVTVFALGSIEPGSYRAQLFIENKEAATSDFLVLP